MDKTVTYMKLLEDSLQKKKEILIRLTELTKEQTILFASSEKSGERHDEIFAEKQQLIDELNELDDGFETTYKKISSIIKNNKAIYKNEIIGLQKLIKEITEMSVNLQVLEMKNKDKFDLYVKQQKSEIRQARESNRMSSKYYQNMANRHQAGQTYFLDKKK